MIATIETKEITLEMASESKKELMKNLMTLYLHDLSIYADDLDINEVGLLEYDGLELFWEKKELTALLIHHGDQVVGFVLLASPPYAPKDIDICIHEFFILRKYRKQGLGTLAINQLMREYSGKYYVMQMENNKPAVEFWKKFYKRNSIEFIEGQITTEEGSKCITQVFTVEN